MVLLLTSPNFDVIRHAVWVMLDRCRLLPLGRFNVLLAMLPLCFRHACAILPRSPPTLPRVAPCNPSRNPVHQNRMCIVAECSLTTWHHGRCRQIALRFLRPVQRQHQCSGDYWDVRPKLPRRLSLSDAASNLYRCGAIMMPR
jgi:hypothetical protein